MSLASRYGGEKTGEQPPRQVSLDWDFNFDDWLLDPRMPIIEFELKDGTVIEFHSDQGKMAAAVARGVICFSPKEVLELYSAPDGYDYAMLFRLKREFAPARILSINPLQVDTADGVKNG